MTTAGVRLLLLPLVLLPLARSRNEEPQPEESRLVTLYAHDDLQSSFDFRRGRVGGRVEAGEIRLEDAQLVYDVFAVGHMSIGFVRDEHVALLDLGDARVAPQERARDLAEEFPIALFHTLFLDGSSFSYFGPGGDLHPYDEADRILGTLPSSRLRHFEPRVGHTYLLRVRREGVGSSDEYFKFQVVALEPAHSLTLRWAAVPMR